MCYDRLRIFKRLRWTDDALLDFRIEGHDVDWVLQSLLDSHWQLLFYLVAGKRPGVVLGASIPEGGPEQLAAQVVDMQTGQEGESS